MGFRNDIQETEQRDKKAIIASLIFIAVGLLVISFAKALDIEGDALYVSLLLLPAILYLILSGRVSELKGPGGLEAKFVKVAGTSVDFTSETIEPSLEDFQMVQKGGVRALREQMPEISEATPIIMTMIFGGKRFTYTREAVLEYIKRLSQFRKFKFIVLLDENGRFLAYMPSWAAEGLLKLDELGSEFIETINHGRYNDLVRYPGVVKETVTTRATNAEALREMERQNLEALVVVDEKMHPKGVVEREQVLIRLMLALAK